MLCTIIKMTYNVVSNELVKINKIFCGKIFGGKNLCGKKMLGNKNV